jgi:hypothetical protein
MGGRTRGKETARRAILRWGDNSTIDLGEGGWGEGVLTRLV